MHPTVYLDHNATTPILPEAADAMREASLRYAANPASQHRAAQQARRALEAARERIGELLGAQITGGRPDRVLFTSGGTEANNLAVFGLLATTPGGCSRPAGHLVTSAIEHPSLVGPIQELEQCGWNVSRVAPDTNGVVHADAMASAIREETSLMVLMAANNETGVLQPVDTVGQVCHERGIPLLVDAAQWVGKLPMVAGNWGAAAVSCAPHKFGGPCGIGVLVVRHDITLRPMMVGGHQQAGLRPGTESVPMAVGVQVALESVTDKLQSEQQRLAAIRTQFERQILREVPKAEVLGALTPRLPNTSNIAFPGVNRQSFFLALDMAGVACSTGSACASGSSEPSPVLVAMGIDKALIQGSLRFSFGRSTSAEEITVATQRILNCYKHLQPESKC